MKILIAFFFTAALLLAQNIEITAIDFKADEKAGFSVFTGDVNIIKGANELNASKVVVYFDSDKKAKRYEAYEDVSFFIEEFVDGEVSRYKGTSQKLIYYPNEQRYEFYEAVDLYDLINKRNIKGDTVHVDMVTSKASVQGSKANPVKFTFETSENNETDNR
jgi:lipopolysaccharide export system protein LptA